VCHVVSDRPPRAPIFFPDSDEWIDEFNFVVLWDTRIPLFVPEFVVERLPTRGEPDDLVFTAPRGGVIRSSNFRNKVWNPAVEASGLAPMIIHDLRDTAASLAISAGASIKAVQRMLGHASAAMTLDVYGGLFTEDLEELADRLEEKYR
jgi:integrase